jgi:hypothetical protein
MHIPNRVRLRIMSPGDGVATQILLVDMQKAEEQARLDNRREFTELAHCLPGTNMKNNTNANPATRFINLSSASMTIH